MLNVNVYKPDGSVQGEMALPEKWFGAKMNAGLLAQAVRVYLSNQRQAKAKSKTRGEVDLTTRKMYRQKGTGRARHGSQSAPIFVGGGKAHGPRGQQNYRLSMPQKMRSAALASALTSKLKDEQLKVVDGLETMTPKTKQAQKIVDNLKLAHLKFTLILPEKTENVVKSFRNLENSVWALARCLNAYEVLNGGVLLFTKKAILDMEEDGQNRSEASHKIKEEKSPKLLKPETRKAEKPRVNRVTVSKAKIGKAKTGAVVKSKVKKSVINDKNRL